MNTATIFENYLPYVSRLDTRPLETLDLIVIHCTELPDLVTARSYGEKIHYPKSKTGNSGHFYLKRNGDIEQWVPANRVAHHVHGYNRRSIGIELVNTGRFPDWFDSQNQEMSEPYPPLQIKSLVQLLLHLSNELDSLRWIAGHEDLDSSKVPSSDNPDRFIQRKTDPGACFPWSEILTEVSLQRLLL